MLCAKRLVGGRSDIDGCQTAGRFTRVGLRRLVVDTLRAGLESAEKMDVTPLDAMIWPKDCWLTTTLQLKRYCREPRDNQRLS